MKVNKESIKEHLVLLELCNKWIANKDNPSVCYLEAHQRLVKTAYELRIMILDYFRSLRIKPSDI